MKEVVQQFLESILHLTDKNPSLNTIYRRFKRLGNGASDVPSKTLQRRMGFEALDELFEVVDQSPCCAPEYIVKF